MVKFIILSTQRSGSTFFRKYIGSHPQIDCHGEIFIKRKWDNSFHQIRYYQYCLKSNFRRLYAKIGLHRLIVPSFLNSFYQNTSSDIKAKGFKLMYSQADKIGIFSSIVKCEDIVFIHLIRRNFLKILVSKEILKATSVPHSTVKLPQRKIKLNTDQVIQNLEKIEQSIVFYKRILRNLNSIKVCYESFTENPAKESKPVLQYLSLNTEAKLNSNLKKISSNNLEDVLLNYGEVRKVLMNTKFEKFIE